MKILLTNDDGVTAEGINSLFNTLSEKHNVYMIAPNEEKSGCSNAITFKQHLNIDSVAENKYSVNGFTADCVNIGLKGELIPKVDLVISGINHGPNLGDDIYFSGTVAGARVAHIYGIPGIALSMNNKGKSSYFDNASIFLMDYLEKIDLNKAGRSILLNINYPDLPAESVKGVKYSALGKRVYGDSYKHVNNKNGEMKLQINAKIGSIEQDGSDITEIKKGFITITPLILDCTDYKFLKHISE